ncbi:SMI1/KNR4 family protein [Acidobacteriota bacterium]
MFFGKSDEWDNKIKLALDLSKAARAFIIPIFMFLLLKFLSPFLGSPISIFTSTWSIIEIFVCLVNVFFLYLWLRVKHMIELYKMIEKSEIRLVYFPCSGSGSGKVEMVGIGKVFIPKDELPIFTANPQYRVKAFADKIIQEGLYCVGSSPQEIAELEQRFDVHFPESYRCFLARMGRSAGNLFDRNNVDVYYSELDRLNRLDREVGLPENSFVITDPMEEPFQYIICDSPDDSPVYQLSKSGKKSRQVFAGVVEWVEYWYSKNWESRLGFCRDKMGP